MRRGDDEALFERLVAGDQECLRPLMERYGDALTLYVNGYVRDIDAAEDLMIEAFSRMLAKRPHLRQQGFKPYLYKTARNLALRHIRLRGRFMSMEDLGIEPEGTERVEDGILHYSQIAELSWIAGYVFLVMLAVETDRGRGVAAPVPAAWVPVAACAACCIFYIADSGSPRNVVACLLVGMTACLASAYMSSFIAQMSGLDAVRTAVEIAKLLPLLFYLAVLAPEAEDIDLAFIMVAVGFATMESAFYLGDAGLSDPVTLLLRGLGTAMMHVVCGVVVGFGLTRAWKHPWLRAAGTFGLLCLASTYHGIFNLLVAAGGAATASAVVLPLATLIPLLVVRRRRERGGES